ncbi:hypothetical protein ES707_17188 [subsurface metagenome]
MTALIILSTGLFPDSEGEVLEWLNDLRDKNGLAELEQERILALTAREYAETLKLHNRLSHRDLDRKTALDRFQAHGGSSLIVGEIIGLGPDLRAVAQAWLESAKHLEVILKKNWTHSGAGVAAISGRKIWVVLFTIKLVEDLRIGAQAQGYTVSGAFNTDDVQKPVLLSGITRLEPLKWDPKTGAFLFYIPSSASSLYHRLGYRTLEGRMKITDAFYPDRIATFFPEKEYR